MSFFDLAKKKMADAAAELQKKTSAVTVDLQQKASAAASNLQRETCKAASDVSQKSLKIASDVQQKTCNVYQEVSQKVDEAKTEGAKWASENLDGKIPSKEEIARWAEGAGDSIKAMADDFDAGKMWDKIASSATKAGQELVVMVLTMYYTIEEKFQNKK